MSTDGRRRPARPDRREGSRNPSPWGDSGSDGGSESGSEESGSSSSGSDSGGGSSSE